MKSSENRIKLKLQDEEKSNLINLGNNKIDTIGTEHTIEVYKKYQMNGN